MGKNKRLSTQLKIDRYTVALPSGGEGSLDGGPNACAITYGRCVSHSSGHTSVLRCAGDANRRRTNGCLPDPLRSS